MSRARIALTLVAVTVLAMLAGYAATALWTATQGAGRGPARQPEVTQPLQRERQRDVRPRRGEDQRRYAGLTTMSRSAC